MQLRRRRCVRPSASAETKTKPKHFLKAILPPPIHANQMRIPEEFITRFGNDLSDVATITVPDGCVWKMVLKKCGNHLFFSDNWHRFAKYYSIGYGSFLVFKYEGNSNFNVVIFDATSAEICYPCKTRCANGEPNTKCSRKRSRVETSDADDASLPSQGHGEQVKRPCNQNHTSRMSNSASDRAKDAANEFKPKNPSFTSSLKRQRVYVPTEFASKYLEPKVPTTLQNSNGEQWKVYCVINRLGSSSLRMVRGFRKFARDNNLSEGDYCVFELINMKPVVLQVTVFRAVEYGN